MQQIKNLWLFNDKKLRILHTLYKCQNDVCGCDLIDKLDIPKNLLSYHMKMLRENKIIEEVKCGVRKNYSICKDKQSFVKNVLQTVELI
ncbi:MAG: winged helix-turn-helix transcriptional regulator [Candidatus Delongbacteria bacterium]|nr:winged helix-turn-helix transcriptional regulator [Candidatus Delongbacteria bacterium]